MVTNEVYHIINRGGFHRAVFLNPREYQRALALINFYRNDGLPCKYSRFISLPKKEKLNLLEKINQKKDFLVEIIAFCLIPNHFHFLLRQLKNQGTRRFVANFSNSYAKYFTTKRKQAGPLFQGRFKAVRVETEAQLLHLSRYIHLNPYTGYVVKTLKELEDYPYSSFWEYLGKSKENICSKKMVLEGFKNKKDYKQFVFDNADYQRKLAEIKHLLLE